MKNKGHTFLIVDDHQMLLEGVREFIANEFPTAKLVAATNYKEIINVIANKTVDVILLDLILKNEDSRLFIDNIIQLQPNVKIIVVSSLEEEIIVNSLFQQGVMGFVGKSSPTCFIADAISTVLNGKKYVDPNFKEQNIQNQKHQKVDLIVLSKREKEVLREILNEKKTKEIADTLFLSKKTVEYYRSTLFTKFEVNNVTGLVKKAILLGFSATE